MVFGKAAALLQREGLCSDSSEYSPASPITEHADVQAVHASAKQQTTCVSAGLIRRRVRIFGTARIYVSHAARAATGSDSFQCGNSPRCIQQSLEDRISDARGKARRHYAGDNFHNPRCLRSQMIHILARNCTEADRCRS
jgi:hypothetical protein